MISANFPKLSQVSSRISERSEAPVCKAQDLASERVPKTKAVISRMGSQPEMRLTTYSEYD